MKMMFQLYVVLGAFCILCLVPACQMSDIQQALSLAERHGGNLSRGAQEFTPEQEHYLGRAVGAQILTQYPSLNSKAANAYLNQLGQSLAMCSRQPYTYGGYHFLLLDSSEVNAFAAPDGLIFVTKGMLGMVSNEGELAAVLAHEIAHVQNRDAMGAIQNSRIAESLVALGSDASRQYGSDLPASQLLDLFSDSVNDIMVTLITKGYSRNQEYAADASAREILSRTGYDPQNLNAVLENMEQRLPAGSTGLSSTHPSAADRLEALPSSSIPVAEPKERSRRFQNALGQYCLSAR